MKVILQLYFKQNFTSKKYSVKEQEVLQIEINKGSKNIVFQIFFFFLTKLDPKSDGNQQYHQQRQFYNFTMKFYNTGFIQR